MSLPLSRLRSRLALVPLALLCAVVVLAGCGSSDSSTSTSSTSSGGGGSDEVDVAAAQKAVAEAKKVPSFELDLPPIENMSKVKGKTAFIIPFASSVPYEIAVHDELKAQLERYGAKGIVFPNKGQPSEWATGVEQAISRNADLIIIGSGANPKTMVPQLEQAKKAGIPVLVTHNYAVGEEPPANIQPLISAVTHFPVYESTEMIVDAAVAETEGPVNALFIYASELNPISQKQVVEGEKRLHELCSSCEAVSENVPVAEWGSKVGSVVQTVLQSHPDINWVFPLYDAMAPSAVAGVTSAGKASTVSVASYNGQMDVLELIQQGGPMKADAAESAPWLGWSQADMAFRILAENQLPEEEIHTPLRLFDSENVGEMGEPPVPTKGFGDAYIKGYEKLWGSPE